MPPVILGTRHNHLEDIVYLALCVLKDGDIFGKGVKEPCLGCDVAPMGYIVFCFTAIKQNNYHYSICGGIGSFFTGQYIGIGSCV